MKVLSYNENELGRAQRKALAEFRERNVGAVLAGGSWVWRSHVRESEAAALAVLKVWGIEE